MHLNCRTLDPPIRGSDYQGREPSGRTPGGATAAPRHMSTDDLMSAAMSSLDVSSHKEPAAGDLTCSQTPLAADFTSIETECCVIGSCMRSRAGERGGGGGSEYWVLHGRKAQGEGE